jgi:hypothetical protein
MSHQVVAMAGHSMARARSLTEFQEAFPDEARCAAFLFERRWQAASSALDVAESARAGPTRKNVSTAAVRLRSRQAA